MDSAQAARPALEIFARGGEMGAQMRAMDWSQTPLGPVESWPQSLRIAVRILLGSGYPMVICWGPVYAMLYNNAYRPILGRSKHPGALGRSCAEVFAEAWDFIGPLFEQVVTEGEDASTLKDQLFLLDRNGYLEECYFTFSYSPIPGDDGRVGGVFVTALETTERVIEDRRRQTLRDLAQRTTEARTEEDVCRIAAETVAEMPAFVPFLLLYLYSPQQGTARLAAITGVREGAGAAAVIEVAAGRKPGPWPLAEVLATGKDQLLGELGARFDQVPLSSWGTPVQSAWVAPVRLRGYAHPAGFLIAGINPRRAFDERYRQALQGIANQIASGIAGARAYEHERQRAEELAELDRARTLFFSNVSHEFRTPLTLMLGPLEDLESGPRGRLPDVDREQIAVARRNALRLLKLVNTLLDFSRIEAGRVEAVYESTDLARFTAEIASAFRSPMEKAGLGFRVECDSTLEPVYVDREMWEKIVLNLLSNALKFTFEGQVTVRLTAHCDQVELAVQDTGVGIPENEVQRVFERFHRVENTRARSVEGTGIGLSLVQELARLHGGTVRAESALGRGSTFTVAIPRGMAHLPVETINTRRTLFSTAVGSGAFLEEAERWLPGAAVEEEEPTRVGTVIRSGVEAAETAGREMVLVADDNADMREYLTRLLSQHYRVHAVSSGVEAVEAAKRLRPELILTDMMMPGLDGYGVLHAVREEPELTGMPVILLSARAGEESQVEGLDAGADDYLIKPFTARELLARVGTHVRMAKIRREAAERESRLRTEAEVERRRLQELLEQAPAAMGLFHGPEHRWIYVNDMYVRVTGRKSGADFIGKTLRESLPEVEGQGFLEILDRVYATGEPFSGREMRVDLNRGEGGAPQPAWFDFVYQPIRNAEGAIQGILVQAVDVTERVTARRAIEVNEERLRLAQAAGQIGTWEWDPVHGRQTLSADLHRIFGTEPGDPDRVKRWAERVEPADWEDVQQRMQEALRTGEMDFEYRYRHPVQGVRWLYCKGRRLEESSSFFGVVLDITDRKRAEDILRQREEEFRSLANGMPQLVCMAHPEGSVFWYNQRWHEYTGATNEQLRGDGWKAFIDRELMPEVMERWNLSVGTGEPFEMTFPIRGGDGVSRTFLTRAVPIRDAAGNLLRWFGTNTDISSEVAIREELERNRERLQAALVASRRLAAIVESSDDAIASKDLAGVVTSWNRRAEQMFGFTAEEMIGQSILKIIPPELHDEEERILETIGRGEKIEHFETVRRRKDGESIEVSLTISPVRDESGRIVAISKIARDITQRKRAERALQTTEKLASVGRLAATIAHEINNPLEAVTNLVYLARQNAVEENVRLYLADAEEELARISLLTRQTLGFYRETRGVGQVHLGQLIGPLISVFGSRTRNKGIEITAEIREDPLVHGIPGEIRQLVANLLNNSIDAVATGGRIRIRLSAASDRSGAGKDGVRLTIADSGPGIPAEIRERLFEPFFTTKKEVGTGLGLWVCRTIVEKHGGEIRLRSSTEPGKSFTAFSVFLPLEAAPTAARPEVRPAA